MGDECLPSWGSNRKAQIPSDANISIKTGEGPDFIQSFNGWQEVWLRASSKLLQCSMLLLGEISSALYDFRESNLASLGNRGSNGWPKLSLCRDGHIAGVSDDPFLARFASADMSSQHLTQRLDCYKRPCRSVATPNCSHYNSRGALLNVTSGCYGGRRLLGAAMMEYTWGAWRLSCEWRDDQIRRFLDRTSAGEED